MKQRINLIKNCINTLIAFQTRVLLEIYNKIYNKSKKKKLF